MSPRSLAVAKLRALLDDGRGEIDLTDVGAVARVASGDAEDAPSARLVDEADALLARARAARFHGDATFAMPAVDRWLADPRGPFSEAVAELDRLGAITSALAFVDPSGDAHAAAAARVAALVERIGGAARVHGALLLDAAILASERIAAGGVDGAGDGALIALADVLGARLDAALAGEPLEAKTSVRAARLDASRATELGVVLAKALGRTTLDVSPDLLELAAHLVSPASARDIVLHGTEATESQPLPVEILRGVHVTIGNGELVADVADRGRSVVMLVPIERGEPGTPCTARGGATTSETVFTLHEVTAELDGYALVVGDRIAFLRVR